MKYNLFSSGSFYMTILNIAFSEFYKKISKSMTTQFKIYSIDISPEATLVLLSHH